MNYPVWQLAFTGGLLIAAIAVLHVFVSHFAVGGGAYLVLTERRAYSSNDSELLGYVRHHSKFFALLTLVFGAVTGVGIWFTIGLVSPEATSSLIHTFVWGWAIDGSSSSSRLRPRSSTPTAGTAWIAQHTWRSAGFISWRPGRVWPSS